MVKKQTHSSFRNSTTYRTSRTMSNAYFYVRIIVTYFSQSARYRATRGGENNKTLPLPSPCALLLPPFSSLSHPLFVFALSFIRFVIPRKIFTYGPTYPYTTYAPYAGITHVTYQNLSLQNELNHMLAHVTYIVSK